MSFGNDDSFEFNPPSNVDSGGDFIDKPGTYLLKVDACKANQNAKGEPEDGTLAVKCVVVGASPENIDQEGKTTTITARRPRLNDSSPDFQKKKLARLGIAMSQMLAADLQQGVVKLNPPAMAGRYMVCKFDTSEYQGKTSVRLSFAEIYHVDDVKAQGSHLNPDIIASIPQDQRRDPKELAKCYSDPHSAGGMREVPTSGQAPQAGGSLFDSL